VNLPVSGGEESQALHFGLEIGVWMSLEKLFVEIAQKSNSISASASGEGDIRTERRNFAGGCVPQVGDEDLNCLSLRLDVSEGVPSGSCQCILSNVVCRRKPLSHLA
jgi:hypothetical protein